MSTAATDTCAPPKPVLPKTKVEAVYAPPGDTRGFVTPLGLLENRFQFQAHLAEHLAEARINGRKTT